jgi:hypothetical protein
VKKIAWSERPRADIRRLDRDTAMRIFTVLHRFAETGGESEARRQIMRFYWCFAGGVGDGI